MNQQHADPNGRRPSLEEILEVIRPQVEKIEEGFTAIRVTLDALSAHLGSGQPSEAASPDPGSVEDKPSQPPRASAPAATAPAAPLPRAIPVPAAPSPIRAASAVGAIDEAAGGAEPAAPRQAERPGVIAASGGDGGNWSRILFGERLGAAPSVPHLSGTLLADVYRGDNDAAALAGQIMTFRTATAEQKPRLLKEIGEAFYAWRPHAEESLLEPLIAWVHAELDVVGLGNRIMVSQPGDRYDMQRHNAKQPGVEVIDVLGWIVLRDNGKVYSKANVTVR